MVKVSIKKNVKPKTMKQKQKQTQKTNVTVNIGSNVIKKKRGRPPTKKAKIEKQPTQPSITQSYIQPIFKQSTLPQQPTLTSSILATQEKPKIMAEEIKEQTSIKKALQEQNLQTDEPITSANDLERVRNARIKKIDVVKEIKTEKPFRNALLGQVLSNQQDDTEEIQVLMPQSEASLRPKKFKPIVRSQSIKISENPLISFSSSTEPPILSQENKEPNLFTMIEEAPQEPVNEEQLEEEIEQGSQEEILKNQQQEPEPSLLQAINTSSANQLLKIPTTEATLVKLTPAKQIENKWNELRAPGGPLESSKPTLEGRRKTSKMLFNEIQSIEPSWIATSTGRKTGPKPRTAPKRSNLTEDV